MGQPVGSKNLNNRKTYKEVIHISAGVKINNGKAILYVKSFVPALVTTGFETATSKSLYHIIQSVQKETQTLHNI